MTANTRQVGGDHYVSRNIQPWDVMEAYMAPDAFQGFLWGNAIKYVLRWRSKGGVEDLRKAQHYIDRLIEAETRVETFAETVERHKAVVRDEFEDTPPDRPTATHCADGAVCRLGCGNGPCQRAQS